MEKYLLQRYMVPCTQKIHVQKPVHPHQVAEWLGIWFKLEGRVSGGNWQYCMCGVNAISQKEGQTEFLIYNREPIWSFSIVKTRHQEWEVDQEAAGTRMVLVDAAYRLYNTGLPGSDQIINHRVLTLDADFGSGYEAWWVVECCRNYSRSFPLLTIGSDVQLAAVEPCHMSVRICGLPLDAAISITPHDKEA